MAGMDPATQESGSLNQRLRNLLKTHRSVLAPELLRPDAGAVLIEQGGVADSLLLVQQGRLAVEVNQKGHPTRTIAEVGPGDVLGEMALFGRSEARHGARVRVLDHNSELLRFSREALHQAILFDCELAAEIVLISSERCRNSNWMLNQLLDGIDAAARQQTQALKDVCNHLRNGPDSMVLAADQLEQLLTVAARHHLET